MSAARPAAHELGYASRAYAAALDPEQAPLALPGSGGHLLVRSVGRHRDAAGPYPLFACRDWARLGADLDALRGELVSVVLVADPFGEWTPEGLSEACVDLARPFKDHLVADLALPAAHRTSDHHRRNARKARASVEVERVPRPADLADAWVELYGHLVERHRVRGPAAFSARSLRLQLEVPGARLWVARRAGSALGAVLWYARGEVASYHLAAYSEEGYAARASFALFERALDELAAEGLRWAHLGAGAGATPRADDGLLRFKRGWATGTRPAWICGRVLDRAAYDDLARERGREGAGFFPAYRAGEVE